MTLLLASLALGATERFAVVAGSNDGGPERAVLRYADTDASDVAEVLGALGGLAPENLVLLHGVDSSGLRVAVDDVARRVAAARDRGDRTEVFFYYSGHSDETGLLPGGGRYDYADLRDQLAGMGADVQLVILDSCASGGIRTKGGTMVPPFLADASVDVKGHAYLTSSAVDESAQESDRIGASYFTHALVTGLRGAADVSGDGRVTLTEAYLFAKNETLARTERSLAGPQHAEWEINLAGSGDLVVTSLDATAATLHVPEGVGGRLFVRDEGGDLVAELSKPSDRGLVLGMAPGRYTALLVTAEQRSEADFVLETGETLELAADAFRFVEGEVSVSRGDTDGDGYVDVGWDAMIVPTRDTFEGPREVHHAAFGLLAHHADRLQGAQVAFGVAITSETVDGGQVALAGTYAGGDVNGGQVSVGANMADGDVRGAQWTVGFNGATGGVRGVQLAVGANYAGGPGEGLQGAVGANVATEPLSGAQLAVGLNVAESVTGAQGSAGVNVAKQVKGVQFGLVNVGDQVDGLQLGVVNVARDADESVALIPINLAGYNHVVVTSSASDHLDLGATFGGKHLYTSLRYGLRVQEDGVLRHTPMVGFGVHAGKRLFVDTDVVGGSWFHGRFGEEAVVVHGRVGLGFEIVKGLAVVAGPTVSGIPWRNGPSPYRVTGPDGQVGQPERWGWPGLFAGVRLL